MKELTEESTEESKPNLGYPDLEDAEFVYRALLDHGMFADKIPPCFKSEGLVDLLKDKFPCKSWPCQPRGYIQYFASRHSNVPRDLAIPHPNSYIWLCDYIKSKWSEINIHIGKTERKNYLHVRKISDEPYILDMNYKKDEDKSEKERLRIDYLMGCTHIVKVDIANCFPSMYSHSIPWALMGKDNAKVKRRKQIWENKLDCLSRNLKNGETNGLLIGPHTSNIISEIVLTQVDKKLCDSEFKSYIRHIDDYEFYANNENNAFEFIKNITLFLKEYDLNINQNKTKITPVSEYRLELWVGRLKRHPVALTEKSESLNFSKIQDFIEQAMDISKNIEDLSPLKYAIRVISNKNLLDNARLLYVKRIIAMTIIYPYLLPLLEGLVFRHCKDNKEISEILKSALPKMMNAALYKNQFDAISFGFYYAIKYGVKIENSYEIMRETIEIKDCISILLAWKYCIDVEDSKNVCLFDDFASNLRNDEEINQDRYWIFLYEYSRKNKISLDCKKQFVLSYLMKEGFTFFRDKEKWESSDVYFTGYEYAGEDIPNLEEEEIPPP